MSSENQFGKIDTSSLISILNPIIPYYRMSCLMTRKLHFWIHLLSEKVFIKFFSLPKNHDFDPKSPIFSESSPRMHWFRFGILNNEKLIQTHSFGSPFFIKIIVCISLWENDNFCWYFPQYSTQSSSGFKYKYGLGGTRKIRKNA